MKAEQHEEKSNHPGLTQANRPPRNPVRFKLCQEFELHPTQINDWKRQLLERAADVFGAGTAPEPVDLAPLHAKIGQLALENDFLESALTKAGLLSAKR